MMLVFGITGAPLTTEAAPQGIVSFELASTTAQAQHIVSSWDGAARLRASFGLGLDYLFMPLYATTIGLACLRAGEILRRRRWPLANAGSALAWGLWFAALCDAMENVALATMLWNGVATPWPTVSAVLCIRQVCDHCVGGWRMLCMEPAPSCSDDLLLVDRSDLIPWKNQKRRIIRARRRRAQCPAYFQKMRK